MGWIVGLLRLWQTIRMAWRIQESVIRGEIDNRIRGSVTGRIWMQGAAAPLQLELKGNACLDLAGCLLKFRNPGKPSAQPHDHQLLSIQRGVIGDLTASRKVRVPAVSFEEFIAWPKEGPPPPERVSNALYLEWFSESDGRVVIEAVGWELDLSTPEWRLTPAENEQRARDAAAGMAAFLKRLDAAIEKHRRTQKDSDAPWDEHDYERFLKECDARTDKYSELMDKYRDSSDAEEKIAAEMQWGGKEHEDDDFEGRFDEIDVTTDETLEESLPQPDPQREGIDWVRTQDGEIRHPLQHRCFEKAMAFWRLAEEHGLGDSASTALQQFIFEFQTASVKLGGALSGIAEGRDWCDRPFTVAYLKRALHHVHKAQAGLEMTSRSNLLPASVVADACHELFEIREGILRLMDEYRREG
jgi:hypothetical protein